MKKNQNIISVLLICLMLIFYFAYQDGRADKNNHPIKIEQS